LDFFLRIDLILFSIFFALILAAGSRSRIDRPFLDYKLFTLMLASTILELAADAVMWLVDGSPSAAGRAVLLASGLVYYAGHPLAPMFYAYYAVHQVASDSRGRRRWLPLLAVPAVASALISLSTSFTGWYFYLDDANVYHHGPLFLVFAASSYSYLIFAFVFVLATARRKVIDLRTLFALLFFPLPPAIAGFLQIRYYGLVLIWPATVLSLLVIYINIQQRKLSSDYLTGAFNRRRLDEYAEARVREIRDDRSPPGRRAKRFAGFLADVDDFKQINDRLGHAAGDAALVAAVQLIRACLRADDFLARYAGDEFVAILPLSSEEELAQVVSRIRERFADQALPQGSPCRLSLSIGGAVFDPAIDTDADRYIARLDSLMYLEKQSKKALKRGATT
jgi:diguanylate cyclase (GGDEF)-like protein